MQKHIAVIELVCKIQPVTNGVLFMRRIKLWINS